MPRPWRRLKKLCHPRGGSPRGTPAGHTARGVVPRRDAGRAEEQAHLPLGPERLASPGHPRSTHPIDLSVRCGMPRTWNRRRPRAARLQHRSHAASSRRDRHQGRPWCPRDCHPRSSRLARRQGPRGAAQHLAPAAAAARARAKQPRKYLAVHAPELAVEPHLQILRRHRRSLLLRLEHPHRSAMENHVHRLPRLGDRRSLFVRVGIKGAELKEDHTVKEGFSYSGSEIKFDPKGVLPLAINPTSALYRPGSPERKASDAFNQTYKQLLDRLQIALNGSPDDLGNLAVPTMGALDANAENLIGITLADGQRAAPTFEYM